MWLLDELRRGEVSHRAVQGFVNSRERVYQNASLYHCQPPFRYLAPKARPSSTVNDITCPQDASKRQVDARAAWPSFFFDPVLPIVLGVAFHKEKAAGSKLRANRLQ